MADIVNADSVQKALSIGLTGRTGSEDAALALVTSLRPSSRLLADMIEAEPDRWSQGLDHISDSGASSVDDQTHLWNMDTAMHVEELRDRNIRVLQRAKMVAEHIEWWQKL